MAAISLRSAPLTSRCRASVALPSNRGDTITAANDWPQPPAVCQHEGVGEEKKKKERKTEEEQHTANVIHLDMRRRQIVAQRPLDPLGRHARLRRHRANAVDTVADVVGDTVDAVDACARP